MKVEEAIELVGNGSGAALAKKLHVTRQAVWNWKNSDDGMLPELYARRLDGVRVGRRVLRFDPQAYGLDS